LDFDGTAADPQVATSLVELLLARFDNADADADQQDGRKHGQGNADYG
jgi:hypothetical protein